MTILQLLIKAIVEKKLKEELWNVNNEGVKALRELVDENSVFQKHTSGENIARRFDVDPLKVDTDYHYTDIRRLEKINRLSTIIYKRMRKTAFNQDTQSTIFDSYIWSFSANKNNQALNNYGEIAIGIMFRNFKIV